MEVSSTDHPMRRIVDLWLAKLKIASDVKEERFGKYAREAERFYSVSHDFMWEHKYATGSTGFLSKDGAGLMPTFRFTMAKPFEMVALFGPALYHRNPQSLASPLLLPQVSPESLGLSPDDPQVAELMQQDAIEAAVRQSESNVMSCWLNWVVQEQDLKVSARRAIQESIIKGMALLWFEMFEPRSGSYRYPKASFVSVDDFLVDPDADYHEDIQWVARRCVHPVNLVEEKYGLPPGSLKGQMESYGSQANMDIKDREAWKKRRAGQSHDLIEYWEIFSKNGFGDLLKGNNPKNAKYDFSGLGTNCYLAVARGIPYPLNIPSQAIDEGPEALMERASWHTPFWLDEGCGNGWPFARLAYYEKSRDVWPEGIFKSCIGELRFINWCMSFMADRVAAASHTYIGVMKAAGVEIKKQIDNGMAPFTMIEISEALGGKSITDLVSFLQAPSFSIDIWKMVAELMQVVDKRTGLTELLYGLTSRQIRSATEAEMRDQNISVRPDDMASRVEDWLSQSVMKLAEMAVWHLTPEEVSPVLGQLGAATWGQMQERGLDAVLRDYRFRIEAGSTRKPNKGNRISELQEFGQVALPVIQQFAMQGMVEPWNAYITEMAKAMDFDASAFLVQPPPPPPEQQGPTPEEVKSQTEQQKLMQVEQKMELDATASQLDIAAKLQQMEIAAQAGRLDLEQKREMAELQRKLLSTKMQQARSRKKGGA